jgi:hypothetical protein
MTAILRLSAMKTWRIARQKIEAGSQQRLQTENEAENETQDDRQHQSGQVW